MAKQELQRLIDELSDYECRHLLSVVRPISIADRFWEDDMGILYNEHIKARNFHVASNFTVVIPAQPTTDDGVFVPIPLTKSYVGATRVKLPPPERLNAGLSSVLNNRRSRRDCRTEASISLCQLSTLLHHACGVTGFMQAYDYDKLPLRTFPSAGGLQSPEVYFSARTIDGLAPGLYHYDAIHHALELLRAGDLTDQICRAALEQPWVADASMVLMISGCYDRVRWKYSERAYRYMCMDAGFLGQNIYLAAEAMGLGANAIAGFLDDEIETLLGVDGQGELSLLLITVGVPIESVTS